MSQGQTTQWVRLSAYFKNHIHALVQNCGISICYQEIYQPLIEQWYVLLKKITAIY